jgi:O-antigen/teichoic acid export membrane protein
VSAIRKNLLSLLVSQVATWAVSLLILVRVPNYLGAEVFGMLSFAMFYMAFFSLIAGLGTPTLLTREIARDHSLIGRYVANVVVLKLVLIALLSVVAIGLAVLLGITGTTLVLIGLGCVGMLFTEVNGDLVAALGGLERMARSSAFGVVQVYVGSLVGLAVLAAGRGVVAYAAVLTLATTLPFMANSVLVWPYVKGSLGLDRKIWRFLIRGGLPLLVLAAFNMIYGTVDVPLLRFIAGDEQVGWYALAYRWVSIPIFMSTAVVAAYFPRFSALGKARSPEFPVQVNRAIRFTSLVAVPAAVGLGVIAKDLLGFFYEGEDFSNSVGLMQILAIHIPVAAVDTILAMSLIAVDRQRKYVFVAGCAAVLNPIACVVAINLTLDAYDNGAIGAAIVTVGTEMAILGAALLIRPRGVMDRWTALTCGRIVAAGVAMGVVVLVAGDLPLAIQVALGVVAYAVASLAFRTVEISDVRRVLRQVGGGVGSIARRGRPQPEPSEDVEPPVGG